MDRLLKGCIGIAFLTALAACGASESKEVSPQVREEVLEIGSAAADDLVATLMAHLMEAMREGGPAGAVDVCSARALDLTAEVADRQGLDIKRTSMRYRNPANAPDEAETEALKHFRSALEETGELPGPWVQKAGRDEYRYYRPLVMAEPCLVCHGSEEQIDPLVRSALEERYPDDLATGYATGDFRGVIRVTVPAERVAPTGG
jgi:hypothetical protein